MAFACSQFELLSTRYGGTTGGTFATNAAGMEADQGFERHAWSRWHHVAVSVTKTCMRGLENEPVEKGSKRERAWRCT